MNIKVLSVCFAAIAVVGLLTGGCTPKKVQLRPSAIASATKESPAVDAAGSQREIIEKQPLSDIEFQNKQQSDLPNVVSPGSIIKTERILVLPSVSSVDQRMMVYADKLSSWEPLAEQVAELDLNGNLLTRWNGCFSTIGEMFRGYSVLMEALLVQDHPAVIADQFVVDPWLIYQEDIAFLEGGCDEVFISGASLLSSWGRHSDTVVKQSEDVVIKYGEEGRYGDVIVAYQDLMDSQPDRTVSASISKMYGLALLRTGKFEMAAKVLSEALQNMRPSQDERSLRRLVADLLLASGQLEEAQEHYRKLADYFESRKGDDRWVADQLALLGGVDVNAQEFPLYMDVLKGYISFDGQHIPKGMRELVERMEEDFRESHLSDEARQMLSQLEDQIREWVAARLDEVDVLIANNDYVEAKSNLEQMLFDDLPKPMRNTVQSSMDNLLQAEMKYQEEQRVMLAETHSALWDKGVDLLGSEEYDASIDAFEKLLNTGYDIPARANIQKAAEAASVEMRRKSASIFVKARKEKDGNRKKELLQESWQLLHDITVKYPEVKLIGKIKQNLAIIEKHIELSSPVMLQEPEAVLEVEPENIL